MAVEEKTLNQHQYLINQAMALIVITMMTTGTVFMVVVVEVVLL